MDSMVGSTCRVLCFGSVAAAAEYTLDLGLALLLLLLLAALLLLPSPFRLNLSTTTNAWVTRRSFWLPLTAAGAEKDLKLERLLYRNDG